MADTAGADGRTLFGFSDGSVSPDGNVGGYGWLVAVRNGRGILTVLACGGGSALAADNLSTIITSTRMEALGVAAGMSYARDWTGRVEWRLDNTSVIQQYRRMLRWSSNDWTKVNDRDVFGYIDCLRRTGVMSGRWAVIHQRGHVERRKKSRKTWTEWEWGNVQSDRAAGQARRAAQSAQEARDAAQERWARDQDKATLATGGSVLIDKPKVAAGTAVQAHTLATLRPWEVAWEGLPVVGSVSSRIREIKQNTYSLSYLRKQTTSLFYPSKPGAAGVTQGTTFQLDGMQHEVARVEGDTAWYCAARVGGGGEECAEGGGAEELEAGLWETLSTADVAALAGLDGGHSSECAITNTADGSDNARNGRHSGRSVGAQWTERSGRMPRAAARKTRATTTCGLRVR